jgi:hypothetical protein
MHTPLPTTDIPTTFSFTIGVWNCPACDRLIEQFGLKNMSMLVRCILAHLRTAPECAKPLARADETDKSATSFTYSIYVPAQEIADSQQALQCLPVPPTKGGEVIGVARDLLQTALKSPEWLTYLTGGIARVIADGGAPGAVKATKGETVLAALLPGSVMLRLTAYAKGHGLTIKQALSSLLTSHPELRVWEEQEPVVILDGTSSAS